MNWYKRLNEFMKAKAKKLAEAGVDSNLYWNKKDEQAIKEDFTEDQIKRFFKELREYIEGMGVCGLAVVTCPYCYVWQPFKFDPILGQCRKGNCDKCPYGKRHGICSKKNSDFDRLADTLIEKNNNDAMIACIVLSNEFYKNLLEKIIS